MKNKTTDYVSTNNLNLYNDPDYVARVKSGLANGSLVVVREPEAGNKYSFHAMTPKRYQRRDPHTTSAVDISVVRKDLDSNSVAPEGNREFWINVLK